MTVAVRRPARTRVGSSWLAWWPCVVVPAAALVAVGATAAALVVWVIPVIWAAVFDAYRSRLPDRFVLTGVALMVLLALTASSVAGSWLPIIETCGGVLFLAAPLGLMHVVSPTGLGYGDVKYGVLVGAGLGYVGAPGAGLLVLVVAAVLQLLVVWARTWPAQRRPDALPGAAPFGPSLATASVGWMLMTLVTGGM